MGVLAFGLAAYDSYNRVSRIAESFPTCTDGIREIVEPLNREIAKVEESAGRLNPQTEKKITEVKVKQPFPGRLTWCEGSDPFQCGLDSGCSSVPDVLHAGSQGKVVPDDGATSGAKQRSN